MYLIIKYTASFEEETCPPPPKKKKIYQNYGTRVHIYPKIIINFPLWNNFNNMTSRGLYLAWYFRIIQINSILMRLGIHVFIHFHFIFTTYNDPGFLIHSIDYYCGLLYEICLHRLFTVSLDFFFKLLIYF